MKYNPKFKGVLFLICMIFLSGCFTSTDEKTENVTGLNDSHITEMETFQNSTQFLVETQEVISEMVVEKTSTPVSTPLPIIEEGSGCETEIGGHILFLSNEYSKRLFVMDGNGCNIYKVMEDASGSADWTTDGQKIVVGCEKNRQICILDAQKTLASCQKREDDSICEAVIIEKYPLPEDVGEKLIYNLSWSGDGNTILVDFAVLPREKNIYLLHLDGTPEWELKVEGSDVKADYSPVEERIMMDGLYEINLEQGVFKSYLMGQDPQWSPDGQIVAFLQRDGLAYYGGLEPMKIVGMKIEPGEDRWLNLYDTRFYDPENWQRRNVIFSDNEYRILSWSPDSRYIAFVGDYRYEGDSQIFRLDIETGEIFVLTTKLDDVYGEMQYIAPAWGP